MKFGTKILSLLAVVGIIAAAFMVRSVPPNTCKTLPRYGLWYWAGVKPIDKKILASDNLYLHQGSVDASKLDSGILQLVPLGISPHKLPAHRDTYLVYRFDKLGLADQVIDSFKTDSYQWELRGNSIQGIQLDFDSPTYNLGTYIEFLKEFRKKLPQSFKLSVTGLADWPATGDSNEIQMILDTSDEIIFQLYAGKAPVKNLNLYLNKFSKLSVDFKLGVLESMDICSGNFSPVYQNQHFKGFTYFLLNPDTESVN